ncbi:MAG: hypothetical protein IPF41_10715, partial [Flavobacteriales bacterium]|nr:hypothetical protein [Flavobacteriales bacterium]
TDYREEPGQLRQSTKSGFEAYRVEQVNKETGEKYFVTRYKPVSYTEHYQENKARIAVNYRLISLETGEVLMSKSFDRESEDHMYYATYTGNRDALYPSLNGAADLSNNRRGDLRNLLNAPREVKSSATLGSELVRQGTVQMAAAIQQELNERLP